MKNIKILAPKTEEVKNTDLCEFMSIDYDITDLANKIYATKGLKLNTLNLKKSNPNIV